WRPGWPGCGRWRRRCPAYLPSRRPRAGRACRPPERGSSRPACCRRTSWWLSLRGKGAPIADQRQGALRRVLRIVEPEFDLRGVRIEPRRMRRLGGDVIPLTGAVAVFLAVQRENQLSLGDDPHVLGLMMMKGDRRSGRIRREQDVTAVCREPECLEWSVELREPSNPMGKGHANPPVGVSAYCSIRVWTMASIWRRAQSMWGNPVVSSSKMTDKSVPARMMRSAPARTSVWARSVTGCRSHAPPDRPRRGDCGS